MTKKSSSKIPSSLQWVLWSCDVSKLDKQKDKYYIIHQIFAYGTLKEIIWVLKNYSLPTIVAVFKKPFKDYHRSRFYFVKNYLLSLKNWQPNERYYVKNTPRLIR
jgi:hypothetical protein